jgi:ribonuclease Z
MPWRKKRTAVDTAQRIRRQLARDAGVGRLVITHVSSRYDAEGSQQLLHECRTIFVQTTLAKDFYTIAL